MKFNIDQIVHIKKKQLSGNTARWAKSIAEADEDEFWNTTIPEGDYMIVSMDHKSVLLAFMLSNGVESSKHRYIVDRDEFFAIFN